MFRISLYDIVKFVGNDFELDEKVVVAKFANTTKHGAITCKGNFSSYTNFRWFFKRRVRACQLKII
jgi:hypothetical protein